MKHLITHKNRFLVSFLTILLLSGIITFYPLTGITFRNTSVRASFREIVGDYSAQESSQLPPEAPKTLKETETLGKKVLIGFPKVLEKSWQEALAFWQRMINWLKNLWCFYGLPQLQNIWHKINSFLGKEVEKRKPEIEEEFKKEKEEMKEEIPKVGKSLWERFKKLIRD